MAAASPVPREARPYQGRSAGLVTRSAAGAVDLAVVVLLLVVGVVAINGIRFVLHPRGFDAGPTSLTPVLGVFLAVLAAFLAVGWTVFGRTYGGHAMGLRVLDRRGHTPGPLLAITRAVLCVVFPLGLLWCAVGRSSRSVQDVLLGTQVIYDWMPHPREASPGASRVGSDPIL